MTVDGTNNRTDYDPDGVTTTFIYDFRVDAKEDLSIYADSVIYLASYSITGLGEELGGDIIFDVPPLESISVLTIIREMDLTQQTSYPPLGPFPAPSHEKALDKLTWITQQLNEALSRALSAPVGSGSVDYTLPVYAAGEVWKWDDFLQKIVTSSLADTGVATIGTAIGDLVELIDDEGEAKFPAVVLPIATQLESDEGTADDKLISPLTLSGTVGVPNSPLVKTALNASGDAPIHANRAWVNFNGTGVVAIRASGNVSSITDNGVGDYTANFLTAMPDANYAAIGGCNEVTSQSLTRATACNYLTTSVDVNVDFRELGSNSAPIDAADVSLIVGR